MLPAAQFDDCECLWRVADTRSQGCKVLRSLSGRVTPSAVPGEWAHQCSPGCGQRCFEHLCTWLSKGKERVSFHFDMGSIPLHVRVCLDGKGQYWCIGLSQADARIAVDVPCLRKGIPKSGHGLPRTNTASCLLPDEPMGKPIAVLIGTSSLARSSICVSQTLSSARVRPKKKGRVQKGSKWFPHGTGR